MRLLALLLPLLSQVLPEPEELSDSQLRELLRVYKSYDLPLPPEEAELVGVRQKGWPILTEPRMLAVTYATETELFDLGGMRPLLASEVLVEEGESTKYALDKEDFYGSPAWSVDDGWIYLAMAYAERQQYSLAREILRTKRAKGSTAKGQVWSEPDPTLPSETQFRLRLFGIVAAAGLTGKQSWDKTLDLARRIIMEVPEESRPPHLLQFIEDLEITAAPNRAKPRSPEWYLNELIHSKFHSVRFSTIAFDEVYDEFLMQGVDAIPFAIAHLDDRRYTHATCSMAGPIEVLWVRVGELAHDFLASLGSRGLKSPPLSKEEAETWWAKYKNLKEPEALIAMSEAAPATLPFRILANKYPEVAENYYRRKLLERFEHIAYLAADLARSNMAKETKLELLRETLALRLGPGIENLLNQMDAVDQDAAREELLACLERIDPASIDLNSPDLEPKVLAQISTWIGDDRHFAILRRHLRDPNPNLRAAVAMGLSLGHLVDDEHAFHLPNANELLRLMDDEEPIQSDFSMHWHKQQVSGLRVKDVVAIQVATYVMSSGPPYFFPNRDAFCANMKQVLSALIRDGGHQ